MLAVHVRCAYNIAPAGKRCLTTTNNLFFGEKKKKKILNRTLFYSDPKTTSEFNYIKTFRIFRPKDIMPTSKTRDFIGDKFYAVHREVSGKAIL